MAVALSDLIWLRNGFTAPAFVLELVFACERSGIQLRVVDDDVIPSSTKGPEFITGELLKELRVLRPHIVAILEHTPDDRPVSNQSFG